ncbi:hypothetical protein VSS74_07760 [Conexibacter stalactiti]|uniref:DUF2207 domain-containing protein n=1 Tax=Conexibacter stalactiti TaxID=1940611 RepID=A0ABU4HLP9_9ACTN|nr:hypothetical protein [Conexibacter stalactiti]MDW5594226.1 hypothetical protein [Conexibacter stalactiti]MEC5034868.1 hypothetical protein [Conexibacter stalactiti]
MSTEQLELAARAVAFPHESAFPVRRVVERLSFEQDAVRHEVRIDVDLPLLETQGVIPLHSQSKETPSRGVEASAETGVLLPLATRREAGAIAVIALQLALAGCGRSVSRDEERLLTRLVLERTDESLQIVEELSRARPEWFRDATVHRLIDLFSRHALLCVVVPCDGRRRVVSFRWYSEDKHTARRGFAPWRSSSRHVVLNTPTPPADSYHYSVAPPPGFRVESTHLSSMTPDGVHGVHPHSALGSPAVETTTVVLRRENAWLRPVLLLSSAYALLALLFLTPIPAGALAATFAALFGYAAGTTRLWSGDRGGTGTTALTPGRSRAPASHPEDSA